MSWKPGEPIFGSTSNRISKNDFTPDMQEQLIRQSVGSRDPFEKERAMEAKLQQYEQENAQYKQILESDKFVDSLVNKYVPKVEQPYQQPIQQYQAPQVQPQVQTNGMVNNNNINNTVAGSTTNVAAENSANEDPFSAFFKKTMNDNPQVNDAVTTQPNGSQVVTPNQQVATQQQQVQNPGFTQPNVQGQQFVQGQNVGPQNQGYDPRIDQRREQVRGVSEYAIQKGLDPEQIMQKINGMQPKDLVDLIAGTMTNTVVPPKSITDIKTTSAPVPQRGAGNPFKF